jgi:hypothetical protein
MVTQIYLAMTKTPFLAAWSQFIKKRHLSFFALMDQTDLAVQLLSQLFLFWSSHWVDEHD